MAWMEYLAFVLRPSHRESCWCHETSASQLISSAAWLSLKTQDSHMIWRLYEIESRNL